MVEGTPGKPYGCLHAYLNTIEANMKLRYVYVYSQGRGGGTGVPSFQSGVPHVNIVIVIMLR